jgi:RNA-directed DNA polymerase
MRLGVPVGFRQLQREGGPAPGIDGISPADVSLGEFGHIAAKLSQVLIDGRYRPQQTRRVAIDKLGTDEKRILKIGVLLDRVVGKALHETLQPIWETIYLPQSYGFRPGRSAWQMLAAVVATIEAEDRWVLAVDDVRKAFDNPVRHCSSPLT